MSTDRPGGLVKARIIQQDYADGERDLDVPFNPEGYVVGRRVRWREHAVLLGDVPKIEYTGGGRRRLDVVLLLDASFGGRDVRADVDRLESFTRIDPDRHRPPWLLFSWASLQFDGVLESISTSYVLFAPDGSPLRAFVRLVLRERPIGEEREREPLQSPDRAKRRRIRQGDTLPSIAHEEYGDAGAWRRIADRNGLDDPSTLSVGAWIVVPPLERSRA